VGKNNEYEKVHDANVREKQIYKNGYDNLEIIYDF
jgi:hypothetical protein